MLAPARQTFPLVPRRRLIGLAFGTIPSRRRGPGADVRGSRPYEAGDPVSTIDWFASARQSAASGQDEFIVRYRSSDEAPRVALVCDRRPAMGVYADGLPWLSKPAALAEATTAIAVSAAAASSDLAALDFAEAEERGGEPYWLPPGRRGQVLRVVERQSTRTPFDAPEDGVARSLRFLAGRRSDLPAGSFVFVLSDFLTAVQPELWLAARSNGWDIAPVVIQDPTWEQSFPDVASVLAPLVDANDGRTFSVRMSRREVAERKAANERRHRQLLELFASLGFDPVLIGTSDPHEVDRAFVRWAETRRQLRWAR